MAPQPHVKRYAIDIGLDFTAWTADAHASNVDSTTLVAAESADRVVTRDLNAGRAPQR
ncbi:hypothetical protein SDC9_208551 [bioreactor metagenome]|uniref:Uncharacterized protein n=1 Tax=bioreactor metagenome TaxID=1076179 RepID=A0A645JDR2_9ZZZZ